MPVYNSRPFVHAAVESILHQSFTDYEFIIIEDASTDGSAEIIRSFKDHRIRLITHEQNQGLIPCLNQGIQQAHGQYLARMDSDDISLPRRLELQANYLDAHTSIGIVGTQVEVIDENGLPFPRKKTPAPFPVSTGMVSWMMLFRCSLAHPSVMLRRSVFEKIGLYDTTFLHAEDYELWLRALQNSIKIGNLPQSLLCYRWHPANISQRHRATQKENAARALARTLSHMLNQNVPYQAAYNLQNRGNVFTPGEVLQSARLLGSLYQLLARWDVSQNEKKQIRQNAILRILPLLFRWTLHTPGTALQITRTCWNIGIKATFWGMCELWLRQFAKIPRYIAPRHFL